MTCLGSVGSSLSKATLLQPPESVNIQTNKQTNKCYLSLSLPSPRSPTPSKFPHHPRSLLHYHPPSSSPSSPHPMGSAPTSPSHSPPLHSHPPLHMRQRPATPAAVHMPALAGFATARPRRWASGAASSAGRTATGERARDSAMGEPGESAREREEGDLGHEARLDGAVSGDGQRRSSLPMTPPKEPAVPTDSGPFPRKSGKGPSA